MILHSQRHQGDTIVWKMGLIIVFTSETVVTRYIMVGAVDIPERGLQKWE